MLPRTAFQADQVSGRAVPEDRRELTVPMMIRHTSTFSYRTPVTLNPHRLLLRPRESRDVRLVSNAIATVPEASIGWAMDVFGNAVATAVFSGATKHLAIVATSQIELTATPWPVFDIAAVAISYPFEYSDNEQTDLGALSVPRAPDPGGSLRAWVRGFIAGDPTDTLALLKDVSSGITRRVAYRVREEAGVQTPAVTLDLASGSCRDMAALLVEAARILGFGARIVSGYLYDPGGSSIGTTGAGSTHAWAEIYVPGAGWIAFDPTNASVGGANLIPVAVVRDLGDAAPITGSFGGAPDALVGSTVEVLVRQILGTGEEN